MKKNKRFLCSLLCVLLLLALFPAGSALAATDYDIWVGSTRVTSGNASGVTGPGITGTVTYDAETDTLTLNGATVTSYSTHGDGTYGIYSGSALKINITGINEVDCSAAVSPGFCGGIGCADNLYISGTGELTSIAGPTTEGWSLGIYCMGGRTMTVAGGTVTAIGGDGGSYGSGGVCDAYVSVTGGHFIASGKACCSISSVTPGYTGSYFWRTSQEGGFTSSTDTAYTYSNSQKYVEMMPVSGEYLPYYVDDGNDVILSLSVFIGGQWGYLYPQGASVLYKANPKSFSDVPGHWAEGYVGFAAQHEMFAGTGADTFSPDSNMTRAMLATVMYKIYKSVSGDEYTTGGTAFSDVPAGSWYETGVKWASYAGIISGVGGNRFAPESNVTRQEMALMLYRFAQVMNGDTAVSGSLNYPDASSIAPWAQDAALWCQESGIISGRDGGNFVPNGTATRAEVATVMCLLSYYLLVEVTE